MDVIGINSFGKPAESSIQTLVGRALIHDTSTISKDLSSIDFSPVGIVFIFGYVIEAFGGSMLTTSDMSNFSMMNVGEMNTTSFSYGKPSSYFTSFGSVSVSGSKINVSRTTSSSSLGGFHLAFLIYGYFESK